jgi:hypothetical protein
MQLKKKLNGCKKCKQKNLMKLYCPKVPIIYINYYMQKLDGTLQTLQKTLGLGFRV